MESEFLKLVADTMEMDISAISMEIKYQEFAKWDSLMMLNLIMEIEEEFNVSIPMEAIGRIKTLRDLYELTIK